MSRVGVSEARASRTSGESGRLGTHEAVALFAGNLIFMVTRS